MCLSESNRLMMGYKFKVFLIKFVLGIAAVIALFILMKLSFDIGFLTFLFFLAWVIIYISVNISVDAVVYRDLVLNENNDCCAE